MRRKEFEVKDRNRIDEVLKTTVIGYLAFNGPDGWPRITPLNFVYDGRVLWHGAVAGERFEGFHAVDGLTPADLQATVRIRGESLTALDAIFRQFSHYASHIGQIVLLAKHLEWERWESLSIPRRRP